MKSEKKLVFLVDDDGSCRESLKKKILFAGYEVLAFPSAEACLEAVVEKNILPLALITDFDLSYPAMDGIMLIREFGEKYPQVPTLLISSGEKISGLAQIMGYNFCHKSDENGIRLFLEKIK